MSLAACPKCGCRVVAVAGTAPPPACPRCGLTFALWTAEQEAAVVQLDEAALALWEAAQADWHDAGKHDAFLKHCSLAGSLAAAGRRYRQRLDEQPGDAVAARMQERILAMATATLVRPAVVPTPVTRQTWFWVVVLVCAVTGSAVALFLRR
jgi:hypothetical protein